MEDHESLPRNRITQTALMVEGGLGLVALAISWAAGHWPWGSAPHRNLHEFFMPLGIGSAAAIPVFAALVLTDRLPWELFGNLRSLVDRQLVPLFQQTRVVDLLAISVAAGIGEELFFRGLLQAALVDWLSGGTTSLGAGSWSGLIIASILFGLCHWLSATYALMATAMGVLLGLLMLTTNSLLAPIAMHTIYDFLALLYLVRWRQPDAPQQDPLDF
jgi:membrane protease YdiL (CAAX protease family)